MTEISNAAILADHALGWSLRDADRADGATIRNLLLDHIGVMIAGAAEEESARIAFKYVQTLGGAAESSLLDGSARVPAESAAFAHAVAGHSIEMDDVHNGSSLHPGVAVIPAAMAVAEATNAPGRALIEAVVAGYEVMIRVGEAAGPTELYSRGFHPTAVCGPFGAAAAAGRLMGLDVARMVHALGLAWSFASGSMAFQTEGSWSKRMQAGNAARVGMQAARLAAMGGTGPSHVFDPHGFFRSYAGGVRAGKLLPEPGAPPKFREVSLKPYACCRYNQAPVDGILELASRAPLPESEIEDVEILIACTGLPLVALPIEAKRRPADSVAAQFSLPYTAAVAILCGNAGREQYREPWLSDPRVARLAARVRVGSSPEIDAKFPERWGARVTVGMKGGERRTAEIEECLGDPGRPLAGAALEAKFRSLTEGGALAAVARRLANALADLETRPDSAWLRA